MIHAHRRTFLKGGIATIMALSTQAASARSTHGFFARIGLPIGLQLYTLGDEAGKDLAATFATVAGIGYRDIEMPSLFGHSPADVRSAADKAGLAISSMHLAASMSGAPLGLSLSSSPTEIADALGTLGAKRAVMPIALFPENFQPKMGANIQAAIVETFSAAGADIWKRTADLLNERAAALKPVGINVGYHNHNLEFAPIGDTTGWDILAAECDPALVSFEVDVGWIATAGRDPAAFLTKYKGRVSQIHVKDVAAANPVNFALSMQPAEVGSGTLDWARILPAAHAAGVRHFYVEQDSPFALPRIESIRRSFAFLSGLRA
ncbi:MAG TPA: sugar phosphate isomerase/epimerase [Sphingobium sp.]|uniref:sugar phosphate isomerase/epimerase family protein n=1 Tax=Sphingobium sp. TaxID=1912891 RepID=UPI002ED40722